MQKVGEKKQQPIPQKSVQKGKIIDYKNKQKGNNNLKAESAGN